MNLNFERGPMESQVTFKAYFLGLIFSLALTLMAYFLVLKRLLVGSGLIAAIVGLGIVQMAVQLHFFFHLATESKPRWNLLLFLFMLLVLIVIVFGSLWIMYNLNYGMSH